MENPATPPVPRPRGRPRKARSTPAANATRHGLLATTPVIAEIENEADWTEHVNGQIVALNPEGEFETVLAHRIALTLWRLNRLIGFECHAFTPSEFYLSELTALRAGLSGFSARIDRAFPTGPIDHIQRYEAHLHRIFLKDLHELEAVQARRRGDPTPLARVEIN